MKMTTMMVMTEKTFSFHTDCTGTSSVELRVTILHAIYKAAM